MNFNTSFGFYTNETKLLPRNVTEFSSGGFSVPVSVLVGKSSILAVSLMVVMGIWLESHWHSSGKANNYPPGPKSSLAALWKLRYLIWYQDLDLMYKCLVAEYGKVISCFLNFFQILIINDISTLKTAFNNSQLLGRPPLRFMHMLHAHQSRGLAATSGETWKEIRRFTNSKLKSLGMGRKTIEPAISQQVEECISLLRTKLNEPFSTHHFFDINAFNVLWEMTSSQKMSRSDPQAQKLLDCVAKFTASGSQSALLSYNEKLGGWLLALLGMENPYPEINKEFRKFTSQFLNTRLESFKPTSESAPTLTSSGKFDDFTEAFLQKIHSTKNINSAFYGQSGYENLQETIRDFFIAGTETTGTTLAWALLFLALHPEKQEKLQREIDHVLGNRPPTLSDRPTMKYTAAVTNETLRKSPNVPFGVPHAALQDTQIGQFDVPKGATVIANIYAIHHCEATWGDPYVFRPERFLTSDESTLIKHEALVPFGIGKRMCPGMALAYDELFMFVTRIFQEFTITLNPAEPKPTMKFKFGCTVAPLPHTLVIKERAKTTHCNEEKEMN